MTAPLTIHRADPASGPDQALEEPRSGHVAAAARATATPREEPPMRDTRCGTPSPSLPGRTAENRRNPTVHSRLTLILVQRRAVGGAARLPTSLTVRRCWRQPGKHVAAV
jgi:hypothetical protein